MTAIHRLYASMLKVVGHLAQHERGDLSKRHRRVVANLATSLAVELVTWADDLVPDEEVAEGDGEAIQPVPDLRGANPGPTVMRLRRVR